MNEQISLPANSQSPGPPDASSLATPLSAPEMGRLERTLRSGTFVVTTELAPPDSADPADVFERTSVFDGYVDAINATDGSGANCHMSSVAVCALLKSRGYTPVMQISCRDRNRIAMQGDALGAAALGIENILCITGDGVQTGDHPGAKSVFDLDSVTLLHALCGMRDRHQYLSGRALTAPPRLFLGAAANPLIPSRELCIQRLKTKLEAGAQFFQTQYCFDLAPLRAFMAEVRDLGLEKRANILVGVGPLASAKSARWIRAHVPGVHIPDEIVMRIDQAAKPAQEGRRLCVEIIQQIREIPGVAGIHIMAARQERYVREILHDSGLDPDSRLPDAGCARR